MAIRLQRPSSTGNRVTDQAFDQSFEALQEMNGHIARTYQDLAATKQSLQAQINKLTAAAAAGAATSTSSQSIEQNIGTAAQPQNAGVPLFPTNPPVGHPITQPTQMILVGPTVATATLKVADPATDPPQWVAVSTGGGGGGGGTFQVVVFTGNTTINFNSTGAQTLAAIAVPLPAGFLSSVGKRFRMIAGGNYGLQFTTPPGTIFTLSAFLVLHPAPPVLGSGVLLATHQFIPPSGVIFPVWRMQVDVAIATPGAGGFLLSTGEASIQVSTVLGTPNQVLTDSRTGSVDLTQAYDVVWAVTFSAQPGSAPFNQCSIFFGSVEFLN